MVVQRRSPGDPIRICFVCLGNICRSPTAEAVMRELLREAGLTAEIEVDSAGTAGWHIGQAPDQRAVEEANRRGVRIVHRGRQFVRSDFDNYDLILAMDHDNHRELLRLAPNPEAAAKVRYLRSFDPEAHGAVEILDPYYGTSEDFARAYDEIEAACRGLLEELRAHL
ncbi:MAG TPA: low molecular weight protein-tyrosine-phosphatase [Acidimicrobiales bacterium]